MIHEDFNGAGPRFYAKFVQLLPHRNALMELFVAELVALPSSAVVVEVGMGNGSLAQQLLQQLPAISRYVGIEPAEAMVAAIPQDLLSDSRFQVVNRGFEDWYTQPSAADAVISRYVLHDFPDQLESWYGKIARALKPGGIFLNLDVTVAENSGQTRANLEEIVRLARGVVVDDPEEARAKKVFIRHLQGEIERYRPLGYHLGLLMRFGLVPNVIAQSGNNYLLCATKPLHQ